MFVKFLLFRLLNGDVLVCWSLRSMCGQPYSNTIIGTGSIKIIDDVKSTDDCCSACTSFSHCLAYTLTGTTCYLKNNTDASGRKDGHTSGTVVHLEQLIAAVGAANRKTIVHTSLYTHIIVCTHHCMHISFRFLTWYMSQSLCNCCPDNWIWNLWLWVHFA